MSLDLAVLIVFLKLRYYANLRGCWQKCDGMPLEIIVCPRNVYETPDVWSFQDSFKKLRYVLKYFNFYDLVA